MSHNNISVHGQSNNTPRLLIISSGHWHLLSFHFMINKGRPAVPTLVRRHLSTQNFGYEMFDLVGVKNEYCLSEKSPEILKKNKIEETFVCAR